jgi:hypothetical protein
VVVIIPRTKTTAAKAMPPSVGARSKQQPLQSQIKKLYAVYSPFLLQGFQLRNDSI